MSKELYNSLMNMIIDENLEFDTYHKYMKGEICLEIDLSEFDDKELLTEEQQRAAELSLPKYGVCVIEVYPNEGNYLAHFHLKSKYFNKNTNKNLNCCILINDNKFFDHGSKTDKLPKKVMKIINKILLEPSKIDSSKSNWEYIRDASYKLNPDLSDDQVETQPDYENMKNP